ncbi:MAG: helix-turn-helix domain-containing protein [Beijerinckiaceae bacterium]
MIDIAPKFIEADGLELVVLTRAEYDQLLALAQEAEEDAQDAAIYDARKAALASGRDGVLPAEVCARLLRGDRLLKALRKWRGVTQTELAEKTGLAQGYLSDLESGRRTGAPATLKLIAQALDVDPSWLMDSAETT